jgi:hypothetical protein
LVSNLLIKHNDNQLINNLEIFKTNQHLIQVL